MHFDILSALIGAVISGVGTSIVWVLRYNNIHFDLSLERDMHNRTQNALARERNLTEGLAQTLNENMPMAGLTKTTRKTKK